MAKIKLTEGLYYYVKKYLKYISIKFTFLNAKDEIHTYPNRVDISFTEFRPNSSTYSTHSTISMSTSFENIYYDLNDVIGKKVPQYSS